MNAAGVLGTGTASSVSSAVTAHGPAPEFILTPPTATAESGAGVTKQPVMTIKEIGGIG
jgi:hypothetical protein